MFDPEVILSHDICGTMLEGPLLKGKVEFEGWPKDHLYKTPNGNPSERLDEVYTFIPCWNLVWLRVLFSYTIVEWYSYIKEISFDYRFIIDTK